MFFHHLFPSRANRLMMVIPMLNFLSGLSINLYVPALPSIATSLNTSIQIAQNTVTTSILGFSIGCISFGALLDKVGHRRSIIFALIVFIMTNAVAAHSRTIKQLLLILFLQGMMTAVISVGCRAMIKYYFEGKRFTLAVLYTSFAYGFGVVVAPFIGGYLEYYFRWTSAFYMLALCGMVICFPFILSTNQSETALKNITFFSILRCYRDLFKDRLFLCGTAILGWIQLGLTIYPTFAPYFIENELHYSSVVYGKSAGIVGLGYLLGTLTVRFLLPFFSQTRLIHMGLAFSIGSVALQALFSVAITMNLVTFTLPIVLMGFAFGFIFGNLLSQSLKSFTYVGLSLSIQLCFIMAISSLGIFIINFFPITEYYHFFVIYLIIVVLQLIFYAYYCRIPQIDR